jgi:hypothetical protein
MAGNDRKLSESAWEAFLAEERRKMLVMLRKEMADSGPVERPLKFRKDTGSKE